MHPPNIDEVGNLVLLRQAVDVLAASESEQRSLYPPERDPAAEMAALFVDAWQRVAPVFETILSEALRAPLQAIAAELDGDEIDWAHVRSQAGEASAALPLSGSARGPRPWAEQMIRVRGRLWLRRQLDDPPRGGGRVG